MEHKLVTWNMVLKVALVLVMWVSAPGLCFGSDHVASGIGHEPGGRTIGGPGLSLFKGGSEVELLSFLRPGADPFLFVCVTGANVGVGAVSLQFRNRVGGKKTSKFAPGETRVVCGEVKGIDLECHGQSSLCEFRWRVDVLRYFHGRPYTSTADG